MNYWFLYNLTTGVITETHLNTATQWTNIPSGQGVLGPYPQANASVTITDTFNNKTFYTVSNGQLTQVSNYATLQLQQAQQNKIAELEASCASTLNGGFQSTALGTAHTYASDDTAQKNFSSEFAYLNSSLNTDTTVMWNTKESGYTSHTIAQFNQVYKDGRTFQQNTWNKLFNLIGQVNAATTVDQVNAIAW